MNRQGDINGAMPTQEGHMPTETHATPVDLTERMSHYPLLEALITRRSRRFAKGLRLNGGPLAYASAQAPEPPSMNAEAAPAVAARRITGPVLARPEGRPLRARARQFGALYERSRIRIADRRVDVPRTPPWTPPFNKWSANQPGTTYFLPAGELSQFYSARHKDLKFETSL